MSVGSEAFDMHVLQGKKAIKAYWKWLVEENLHPAFAAIEDSKAIRAIGSLVFIVEGGMLDRRVMNDELSKLKEFQDQNFVLGYSGSAFLVAAYVDCAKVVHATIPRLNELRKWAVDNT